MCRRLAWVLPTAVDARSGTSRKGARSVLSWIAMSYLVFARKFRPQTFSEVIGQEPVVRTLKNAIKADRIGHAFLFAGVRGVGKTSMARIFAKALNCVDGPTQEPCLSCAQCLEIAESREGVPADEDAGRHAGEGAQALQELLVEGVGGRDRPHHQPPAIRSG